MLMDALLMIIRALLIAVFGMAAWQWGEPPIPPTYGCFSGPSLFDLQFNAVRLHAKPIALSTVTLLVGEFALQVWLDIRYERARKRRLS